MLMRIVLPDGWTLVCLNVRCGPTLSLGSTLLQLGPDGTKQPQLHGHELFNASQVAFHLIPGILRSCGPTRFVYSAHAEIC